VFPFKNSSGIIKKLFDKGYNIYVVTNGLISLQYPRIVNTSFGKYIRRIFVSEEVGENKPNPKIFNG